MRILAIIILTVMIWPVSFSAIAGVTEGGRGLLFGEDHAFAVTAIPGWVLDNQSGVSQGIYMIFYPKGETWSDSPAIIYGRAVPKSEVPGVKAQVENTIADFRDNGSPNYTYEAQPPLVLSNGRKGETYFFSGDKWGNYEAAVYFPEVDTINFLVFNCRTKEVFEKYIGDFRNIARTYQNLYTSASALSLDRLEKLKRESADMVAKPGGKQYETKAIQAVGQTVANVMQECTSYLQNEELSAFSYFVRIQGDGNASESFVTPTNAMSVCFRGSMANVTYPPHAFGSFLLNMEMKVSP